MTDTKKTKPKAKAKAKKNVQEEEQFPKQRNRFLQFLCEYPVLSFFTCVTLVAVILYIFDGQEYNPEQEPYTDSYVKEQPAKVSPTNAGMKNDSVRTLKMEQPSDELLECYDEGYEQGLEDGQVDCDDGDYRANYDDNNEYTGDKDAYYREGYEHGYEESYEEVIELMESGDNGIIEELVE